MSFEGTKARLVDEFDRIRAEIRAEFNMKTPPARPADDDATKPATGQRVAPFRSAG